MGSKHLYVPSKWDITLQRQLDYIFGNQFCLKNVRKPRFHVFLYRHPRKHVNSPYVDRICKKVWFFFNYVTPGPELNWNKIHNFVWILSTSGKIVSHFLAWIRVTHRFWAFWHFLSKTGRQKYSIWVQEDHFQAHEG